MKDLKFETIIRLRLHRMPMHSSFPELIWYKIMYTDIYICNFFQTATPKGLSKSLKSNLWYVFKKDSWRSLMPQECIEETDLLNEIIKLKS